MAARLETVGEQVSGRRSGSPRREALPTRRNSSMRAAQTLRRSIAETTRRAEPATGGRRGLSRRSRDWPGRRTAASGSGQVALGDAHVDCSRTPNGRAFTSSTRSPRAVRRRGRARFADPRPLPAAYLFSRGRRAPLPRAGTAARPPAPPSHRLASDHGLGSATAREGALDHRRRSRHQAARRCRCSTY